MASIIDDGIGGREISISVFMNPGGQFMKKRNTAPVILFVACVIGCSQENPSETTKVNTTQAGRSEFTHTGKEIDTSRQVETVQSDIRRLYKAFYGGDVDMILDYTHPIIVNGLGGRKNARIALEQTCRDIKAKGMHITKLEFPADPTFIHGEENEFVIVPTKVLISAGGQHMESDNFQFGARKTGESKWTYIEGSRIDNEIIMNMFPDFPPGIEFPECRRKKL